MRPLSNLCIFFILSMATSINNSLAQQFSGCSVSQNHLGVVKTHKAGRRPQSFRFSQSGVGEDSGHFCRISRHSWCCWSGTTLWEPQDWYFPHTFPQRAPEENCSVSTVPTRTNGAQGRGPTWKAAIWRGENGCHDSRSFQALPTTKLKTERAT